MIGYPKLDYLRAVQGHDDLSQHLFEHVDWAVVPIDKLIVRKRQEHAYNLWKERIDGENEYLFYVAIPRDLIDQKNVLVIYRGAKMPILCGAAPEFDRPRGREGAEIINYYPWVGTY